MIAFIKGIVDSVAEGSVVIECGGLGYQALAPVTVLQRLTKGQEVKLLTYLQVKEDGIALFGFTTQEERAIFLRLIAVSGIGPKAALSLLSALTPPQIMLAVITDDTTALCRAPGIGKKTAGRLLLELKDKLRAETEAEDLGLSAQVGISTATGPKQDAIDALTALGYGRSEAVRAVLEVYLPEFNVEQTIKLALKKLAG